MLRRLAWLTLGAFAIGTEGFMIAGLLPAIASDLQVSLATAGQLITVFALVYGVGSPILSAMTANLERRRLLIGSMALFAAANLFAGLSHGFAMLMAARVLLALSAGLFMPAANAFAGTAVEPERRGRALAIVGGGVNVAVMLGVPLGSAIGRMTDWRATFLIVAGVAVVTTVGLMIGLPRGIVQRGIPLAERLAVIGRRPVRRALSVSLFWAMGGFCLYTYIAPLLETIGGFDTAGISLALFLFGVGGFIGTAIGGVAADRLGTTRPMVVVLILLLPIVASFSLLPRLLAPEAAAIPLLAMVLLWGTTGWAINPAQQSRLIGLAPDGAAIVMSLNASALYLGISAGAALGSLVILWGGVLNLGFAGAACELVALGALLFSLKQPRLETERGATLAEVAPRQTS